MQARVVTICHIYAYWNLIYLVVNQHQPYNIYLRNLKPQTHKVKLGIYNLNNSKLYEKHAYNNI
jgi:hypothetical protein